jgi:hypothetical protein
VPDYYHPRRWVVRSRLKFLITRPRLREFADRHGLIVGVVDAYMVAKLEEHRRDIERTFWWGAPQVFVNGEEIVGVKDVKLNIHDNVVPISRQKER